VVTPKRAQQASPSPISIRLLNKRSWRKDDRRDQHCGRALDDRRCAIEAKSRGSRRAVAGRAGSFQGSEPAGAEGGQKHAVCHRGPISEHAVAPSSPTQIPDSSTEPPPPLAPTPGPSAISSRCFSAACHARLRGSTRRRPLASISPLARVPPRPRPNDQRPT